MKVNIDGVDYAPLVEIPEVTYTSKYHEALALKFISDIAQCEITIRDYLAELLFRLWSEQESFSGKRPFGNSGWQLDLYTPLAGAGFISGTIDEEGYLNDYNLSEAREFVEQLIKTMCYGTCFGGK